MCCECALLSVWCVECAALLTVCCTVTPLCSVECAALLSLCSVLTTVQMKASNGGITWWSAVYGITQCLVGEMGIQ